MELLRARIGRSAGLDNGEALTLHVVRHTFGTRLLESVTDMALVAELMGNAR